MDCVFQKLLICWEFPHTTISRVLEQSEKEKIVCELH